MQFSATGGIFLRLDSSGNLNIYNTAGTSIAKFVSGNYSATLNKGTATTNSRITTTTSATGVSMGVGFSITPQISGNVLVFSLVSLGNNTASDTGSLSLFYNTTGIPAGGTGVGSDTAVTSALITNNANTANLFVPAPNYALVTGLTIGTQYFFYVAGSVTGGGTATVSTTNASIFGVEI